MRDAYDTHLASARHLCHALGFGVAGWGMRHQEKPPANSGRAISWMMLSVIADRSDVEVTLKHASSVSNHDKAVSHTRLSETSSIAAHSVVAIWFS